MIRGEKLNSPVLESITNNIQANPSAFTGSDIGFARTSYKRKDPDASIVQEVELHIAPFLPHYANSADKSSYSAQYARLTRTYMDNLKQNVLSDQGQNILATEQSDLNPLGMAVYYDSLHINETIGHERKKTETVITEVSEGTLKQANIEVGLSEDEIVTPLVRRITVTAYPHPLLAVIVPRFERGRAGDLAPLVGMGAISIDELIDLQQNGVRSTIAQKAIRYGLIASSTLSSLFKTVS